MDANKDTLYARWLAGELSSEEEQTLQDSGELEELEAIINTTDKFALPEYDAADGFARFKAKKMPPKTAKVRSLNTRRIWPMLAVAASVLLLVYVSSLFLDGPTSIKSGNMATLNHRFEDETTVVLNDGSKLEYDASNWAASRSVTLKGEAIFTVQKGNPFIVNTPNGTVEVLGTSFNVRAWGDKLHVECYEGKVRVRSNNQATTLTRNQAVNVVKGQMQEETMINHQKPLWSTGSSRFYEEQLNIVFEELERQFDVKVNMPTIERPFSGNFQHDNLEAALNNICKPMGLKFELVAGGKVVEIQE